MSTPPPTPAETAPEIGSQPTQTPALRTALAAGLQLPATASTGRWRAAFATVPRHVFAPRFTVHDPVTGQFTEHDTADPDPTRRRAALTAAYTDDTLITRWAEGIPVSSSTEPSLMAQMLNALDADPGHRVLEIGTGTGYNAALLCEVLGDEHVTTIDVESDLTIPAQERLAAAGYHPAVLCRDGALGAPARAPFDRIIATCGMDRVPTDWINQLAPAGAILANVSKGIVLLRDAGEEQGERLVSGRFLSGAGFMPLRSDLQHYTPRAPVADVLEATGGHGTTANATGTVIDRPQLNDEFALAAFFANLVADRSQLVYTHADADTARTVTSYRWLHPATGSWARVDLPNTAEERHATLYQGGSRRLWDELTPVLHAWQAADRAELTRWGMTVTSAGHHRLWLDQSATTVAYLR
ncbi:protein-L-isoaspartate carboxylmethyltransferase [Actinosynnema pretiosum subsp. pretiosum]|uniref:Protein-L-isoaspartate O-methyltransferase n=1 Tax=Actinosynnema pretiosum subsp. pretiosum TaxID=103721 RepID=A0AA45R3U4_9PSEU|nr:protein-L-isoaspartate carboxylmethyltransferase [Actinosynnema pretiosum subsp. pretiosum]